jgi:hypothetical protein
MMSLHARVQCFLPVTFLASLTLSDSCRVSENNLELWYLRRCFPRRDDLASVSRRLSVTVHLDAGIGLIVHESSEVEAYHTRCLQVSIWQMYTL